MSVYYCLKCFITHALNEYKHKLKSCFPQKFNRVYKLHEHRCAF